MSGGHADYVSSRILDAAQSYVEWWQSWGRANAEFSPGHSFWFKYVVCNLFEAAQGEHHVDWCVSGDTGPQQMAAGIIDVYAEVGKKWSPSWGELWNAIEAGKQVQFEESPLGSVREVAAPGSGGLEAGDAGPNRRLDSY